MSTNDIQPTKPTLASFYQRAKREETKYATEVEMKLHPTLGNTSSVFSFDSVVTRGQDITTPEVIELANKRKEAVRAIRQIEEEMKREYGKSQYLSTVLDLPFHNMTVSVPESLTDESSYRTLYSQLTEEGKRLVASLERIYRDDTLFVDERDYRNTLVQQEIEYNNKAAELAAKASKQFNTTMIPVRIDLDSTVGLNAERFPFDPTGLNPMNHITDVVTIVNNGQEKDRYLIPRYAPFFVDSLKISRVTPEGLIPFVLNEDFICAGLFADILEHTQDGKLVASVIVFDDEGVNGDFHIEYNTLGGSYTVDEEGLSRALNHFIDSPMIYDWGEIVGKPLELPAEKTQHDISDFRSFEDVVRVAEKLNATINLLVEQQQDDDREHGFNTMIETIQRYVADMNRLYEKTKKEAESNTKIDEVNTKIDTVRDELTRSMQEMLTGAQGYINQLLSDHANNINTVVVPDLEKKIQAVKDQLASVQANETAINTAKQELRNEYTGLTDRLSSRATALERSVSTLNNRQFVEYKPNPSMTQPTMDSLEDKQIDARRLNLYTNPYHDDKSLSYLSVKLNYHHDLKGITLDLSSLVGVGRHAISKMLGVEGKDYFYGERISNSPIPNEFSSKKQIEKAFELINGHTAKITSLEGRPQAEPFNENKQYRRFKLEGNSLTSADIYLHNNYILPPASTGTTIADMLRIDTSNAVGVSVKDLYYANSIDDYNNRRYYSVRERINTLFSRLDRLDSAIPASNTVTNDNQDTLRRDKPVITHGDKVVGINGIRFTNGDTSKTIELYNANGKLTSDKAIAAPDISIGTQYPSLKTTLDTLSRNSGNFIPLAKLQPENALGHYNDTLNKIPLINNDGRVYLGQSIVLTSPDLVNENNPTNTTRGVTFIRYLYDTVKQWNAIDVTGIVHCDALYPRSDEKLKDDIQTIRQPIEKIKQLRGCTYQWKQNHQKDMGVIAQEIEQVLPELVNTDDTDTKSVNYNGLIALLLEGMKQQQAEIDELRDTIKQLTESQHE